MAGWQCLAVRDVVHIAVRLSSRARAAPLASVHGQLDEAGHWDEAGVRPVSSGMPPGPGGSVAVQDMAVQDMAVLGVTAADALECASRSYEVQQFAARVARCADEADAVLSALARLELQSWQSPAGRAYRVALSLHAAALHRSRDALLDAVAVVLRHARNVAQPADRMGP